MASEMIFESHKEILNLLGSFSSAEMTSKTTFKRTIEAMSEFSNPEMNPKSLNENVLVNKATLRPFFNSRKQTVLALKASLSAKNE